jgi:hypothetical protein
MPPVGKAWNKLSILERRRRKSMEQQHDGSIRRPGFAVEHTNTIRFDEMV